MDGRRPESVRGVDSTLARERLTDAEARGLERFIARAGSVRRAADACGVSSPAIEAMRWGGLTAAGAVSKVRAKISEEVPIG